MDAPHDVVTVTLSAGSRRACVVRR